MLLLINKSTKKTVVWILIGKLFSLLDLKYRKGYSLKGKYKSCNEHSAMNLELDVETILNFIYSGATEVMEEELDQFLALARSLQVQGLSTQIPEQPKELGLNARKKSKPRPNKDVVQIKSKESKTEPVEHKDNTMNKTVDEYSQSMIEEENASDIVWYKDAQEESEGNKSYDSFNTSSVEFDEKVSELVDKSEVGWKCKECPYDRKSASHVREHVEMHITGFLLSCQSCDRRFSTKKSIRNHQRKCDAKLSSNIV